MKKLLCLSLVFVMLFLFAACGGDDKDSSSKAPSNNKGGAATAITFDAESYTIKVDEYIELNKHLTVTPEGATVVFSSSDDTIAERFSAKGEFHGLATGEVTVTAASEDGSVKATCKLIVAGFGNIVARNGNEGGILNRRYHETERPADTDARILIISKNIAAGTDMTNATKLNYGELLDDGSAAAYYDGYYVAKTGNDGNFELKDIPVGDYVALIVSSMDFTNQISYADFDTVALLKATAIAQYLSDAQIATLADQFPEREFAVKEITVKANEISILSHEFQIDDRK